MVKQSKLKQDIFVPNTFSPTHSNFINMNCGTFLILKAPVTLTFDIKIDTGNPSHNTSRRNSLILTPFI